VVLSIVPPAALAATAPPVSRVSAPLMGLTGLCESALLAAGVALSLSLVVLIGATKASVMEDGGGSSRPRTVQFDGGGGGGSSGGPSLGPASQSPNSRQSILIGHVTCPVESPRHAKPCRSCCSWIPASPGAHVEESVVAQVDFGAWGPRSPSPLKHASADPMLDEATLCTPLVPANPNLLQVTSGEVPARSALPPGTDLDLSPRYISAALPGATPPPASPRAIAQSL
jgi:hypothetical protein